MGKTHIIVKLESENSSAKNWSRGKRNVCYGSPVYIMKYDKTAGTDFEQSTEIVDQYLDDLGREVSLQVNSSRKAVTNCNKVSE